MEGKALLAAVLVCLMSAAVTWGQGRCPSGCTCQPDELGRKQVTCSQGGMTDSAFLNYMDVDTRVLIVTSPEYRPNQLTIGPTFRRFSAFIEEITITRSAVPAIGENSFFGLRLLRRLDLSHNLITNLHASQFNGLTKLRALNLAGNRIESVASGAFEHLPRLESLNLSGNSLPALPPSMFRGLGELRQLDLSGAELAQLEPDVFRDVPELRELRCAGCDLTKISPRLYQMVPRLHVLDLRDNHLSTLRPGEFVQLRDLKQLLLGGNHFTSVDSLPFAGHRLKELDLSRNQLASLPTDLFRDVTVRRLDLSYNELSALSPRVLRPLGDHLHWLSLSGNPLPPPDVEAVGRTAPHLKHLSLADMGVVALSDGLWPALPHLASLNMSGNYLRSLSEHMLRPLRRLQRLDASDNQLARLTQPVVSQLARLEHVRLHGNPWVCDACQVPPLLEWLQAEGRHAACAGRHCPRCAEPRRLAGVEVRRLNASSLPACGESSAVLAQPAAESSTPQLAVIVGCVLALLLLTAVVVALLVYNRHSAVYYTHEDERDDADVYQKADVNKNKKRVRIATIDEVNGKEEGPFVDEEPQGEFQNG